MKILVQIGLIFGLCWVSQIIESILPFPFPASVISLIVLLVLLLVRLIKTEQIKDLADFLSSNLGFFFIPVSSSLINYFDVIQANLLPFFVICVVSMILTYGATVGTVRLTCKLMEKRKENKE